MTNLKVADLIPSNLAFLQGILSPDVDYGVSLGAPNLEQLLQLWGQCGITTGWQVDKLRELKQQANEVPLLPCFRPTDYATAKGCEVFVYDTDVNGCPSVWLQARVTGSNNGYVSFSATRLDLPVTGECHIYSPYLLTVADKALLKSAQPAERAVWAQGVQPTHVPDGYSYRLYARALAL